MPLIVPEHFNTYTLMGIDPGLNNTGIATYEIDYATNNILSIEAFTLTNDKLMDHSGLDEEYHPERAIKLLKLREALIYALSHIQPAEVACEAPFFNRLRPMAYGALLEVVSVIYMAVIAYNVNTKFIQISPLSVKKYIGTKAVKNDTDKGKDLVKLAVSNNPEIMSKLITDFNLLSEHAIDAIAVAYGLWKLRSTPNV